MFNSVSKKSAPFYSLNVFQKTYMKLAICPDSNTFVTCTVSIEYLFLNFLLLKYWKVLNRG